MTRDVIEEVRVLAPVAETTSEVGRARQRRKLTHAIAAESQPFPQGRPFAPVGDAVSVRTGHGPRRRTYLAGVAAAMVAAAGVAIPLSLGASAPAASRVAKSSGPVMQLASYRLRLPSDYRLTAATTTLCPVLGVGFVTPDSTPKSGVTVGSASPVQSPEYASEMAAAANADGGCIAMVLAPAYTPTAADPDPEAGTFENTQPVQVGPFQGREGTWTTVAKPSDVATQQASLYVEIPVAGGQDRDLAVSANNLSENALVSLVANGLSVAGSSSTESTPIPTFGNTGTAGN